ncbi:MAG: type II toxin-antitoxin system HicA family toxin [Acidiferrobacteraceae bacterium]
MRQHGNHVVMPKRLPDTTITVPVPNHAEILIGTLQAMIRQSGVACRAFES